MDHYKETFNTWNKMASLYEEKFMDLHLYDDSYDLFCMSIVKVRAKVLDVGCGPGNITKYLLSKRPDFQVEGIDIASNMIALAQRNNPTARFCILDSRQIDQLDEKFDGVICGFCLPYLSETDTVKFIADCFNLLNNGGSFYLSFVEGNPASSGFKMNNDGERVYFYYHDLDILAGQLAKKGFEKPNVFRVGYKRAEQNTEEIHTILITKK